MPDIFSLPLELIHHILSHLPLSAIYQLGASCRHFHKLIHQDERFWKYQTRTKRRIIFWNGEVKRDSDMFIEQKILAESDEPDTNLFGIIFDPTLQGHKEAFLLSSPEFKNVLKSIRRNFSDENSSRTSASAQGHSYEPFEKLKSFFTSTKFWLWPSATQNTHSHNNGVTIGEPSEPYSFQHSDGQEFHQPTTNAGNFFFGDDLAFSARIALFGPGIEHKDTKKLVGRMVNSHSSLFDAIEFVTGSVGCGSGVRIEYEKSYRFDLLCLYTNSAHVRESLQRSIPNRLQAEHNKLLTQDLAKAFDHDSGTIEFASESTQERKTFLNESVRNLLPGLNAIIFALNGGDGGYDELELKCLRAELELVLEASRETNNEHQKPLLILNCFQNKAKIQSVDLETLAEKLGVKRAANAGAARTGNTEENSSNYVRSWAIFNVEVGRMAGISDALDWLLYHVHKRRNRLEYHLNGAKSY